jgi:hypothetical protein
MCYMRILFTALLLHSTVVTATELEQVIRNTHQQWRAAQTTAPATVVAQAGWPHRENITLLTDTCGNRSDHLRAQWVTRDSTVIWGCWHYNPTGVIVDWNTGRTEHIDWFVLYHLDNTMPQQLGYQRLHERVAFLRSVK